MKLKFHRDLDVGVTYIFIQPGKSAFEVIPLSENIFVDVDSEGNVLCVTIHEKNNN